MYVCLSACCLSPSSLIMYSTCDPFHSGSLSPSFRKTHHLLLTALPLHTKTDLFSPFLSQLFLPLAFLMCTSPRCLSVPRKTSVHLCAFLTSFHICTSNYIEFFFLSSLFLPLSFHLLYIHNYVIHQQTVIGLLNNGYTIIWYCNVRFSVNFHSFDHATSNNISS